VRRAIWFSLLIAISGAAAEVLKVDDFGAAGDGKQDDISAVVAAVAALKQSGPGSVLAFTPGKTYRLGLREESIFQIDLQGLTNVTVEGNGAMLLCTPMQAAIRVAHSRDVTVRNLLIEQDPLSFTQGTITAVEPQQGFFVMNIDPGYPLPPDEETLMWNFGRIRWEWGAVIDPVERRIRKGVRDHFWVTRIVPNDDPASYRVELSKECLAGLEKVRAGDKYFQPLNYNSRLRLKRLDAGPFEYNISFENSTDCVLENVTLYSGRSSMSSSIENNDGRITFRGFKVMVRPGTDRLVSNWRDGIHCKDNRVGPLIENCYFEALLDDSINMSQNTIMAMEVISETTFKMTKFPGGVLWTRDTATIREGDRLMVFHPATGEYEGPVQVVSVADDFQTVTLERAVKNVVTGLARMKSRADIGATHFYNMDQCNSGFIIRNNIFRSQRRHAILARATDGLIEHNLIEDVGGNGITLYNEYGNFNEGPFPRNIIIRNNTIRGTLSTPVEIRADTGKNKTRQIRNIRIENNLIVADESPVIRIENAQDIVLENNRCRKPDGSELPDPVSIE
jgi:hypothetical protein